MRRDRFETEAVFCLNSYSQSLPQTHLTDHHHHRCHPTNRSPSWGFRTAGCLASNSGLNSTTGGLVISPRPRRRGEPARGSRGHSPTPLPTALPISSASPRRDWELRGSSLEGLLPAWRPMGNEHWVVGRLARMISISRSSWFSMGRRRGGLLVESPEAAAELVGRAAHPTPGARGRVGL